MYNTGMETTEHKMRFEDLLHDVNEMVGQALAETQSVSPEALGLDRRASWSELKVTDEFIAVPESQDRTMRYYGGFEYVSEEHRTVLGDWVFYSVESNRVREHLGHVFPELAEQEDYED
jgi:hypothetical protein